MQKASKGITESVLITDQSSNPFAALSLYIPVVGVHAASSTSISTAFLCSVYRLHCSFGHGPLQTD